MGPVARLATGSIAPVAAREPRANGQNRLSWRSAGRPRGSSLR